jgi:hypothetical protein
MALCHWLDIRPKSTRASLSKDEKKEQQETMIEGADEEK